MKKILFNDKFALTQAVLDGRKTQTRRIVSERLWDRWTEYDDYCNSVGVSGLSELGMSVTREYYGCDKFFLDTSPYTIGEVVAVAQSYHSFYNDECNPLLFPDGAGWTNKMFVKAELMPHRIRITDVRVERLQDISESDCIAEGVKKIGEVKPFYSAPIFHKSGSIAYLSGETPREAYAALIDKISGKGTWKSNPYIFAYTFELINPDLLNGK